MERHELGTRDAAVQLEVMVRDPDHTGPVVARVFLGKVGSAEVKVAAEVASLAMDELRKVDLALGEPGTYFAYVEVHETDVNRMAWSAPIWIVKR